MKIQVSDLQNGLVKNATYIYPDQTMDLAMCLDILSAIGRPIEQPETAFIYEDGKRVVLGVQPESGKPVDLWSFTPCL